MKNAPNRVFGAFLCSGSAVVDGLHDLLGNVLVAGDGGVAVQLRLSVGHRHVVDVIDLGELLLELAVVSWWCRREPI